MMLGRSVALSGVYDRWLERIKTWLREQPEKAETDAVFDEYERQRRLFEEAGQVSPEPSDGGPDDLYKNSTGKDY